MSGYNKFILDFEEFGAVHFKNETVINNGTGNQPKTYFLNEQQTTLLMTYLKNTSLVRAFKIALVKEFYKLRQELYPKQEQITIENPNSVKNPAQVIGGYKGTITRLQIKVRELEAGLVPVPTTRDLSKELLAVVEKGLKYDDLMKEKIKLENIYKKYATDEYNRQTKALIDLIGEELGSVGEPYIREILSLQKIFISKPIKEKSFIRLGDILFA